MKKITFTKVIIIIFIITLWYLTLKQPPNKIYKINIIGEKKVNILTDDFNNNINIQYWNIIQKGNNYNNELQFYHPDNIIINDSVLTIEARKENIDDHYYTSGSITTKNKFEFLYGKIIFRAKAATGKGVLSAVWLLPADDTPLPEIDIIEILGTKPDEIWAGMHYLDYGIKKSNFNTYNKNSDDYAIYELHWKEREINWYVNGKLIHKITNNIPDKKMYLIINLAVGGDWPKEPNDNIFPTSLLIDYLIIIPEKYNEI